MLGSKWILVQFLMTAGGFLGALGLSLRNTLQSYRDQTGHGVFEADEG